MSSTDPNTAEAAQAAAAKAFQEFTVEAFTLLAIGLCFTVLRTAARIKIVGVKGLRWDDILVWVGTICHAAETGLAYSVGHAAHGLANNGMTDAQRAALRPDSPEYQTRVLGSKIQIAGWSTYSVLLWSLKLSLLIFYRRLTTGVGTQYRIRVNIGFGFLAASFVAITTNLYLACRPFHKYWQINPDPGNVCQPAISNQVVWMYLAFNVSTDLYLLSIPLPMLWASALKPVKKAGLMVVFGGGLLVVAFAILRCAMIFLDPVNGAQLAGSWAVRETFVAVVTTNLPMIFPAFKIWLAPLITSLRSTMSSQKLTANNNKTPNGGLGGSRELRTFGAGRSSLRAAGNRRRGEPPTLYNVTAVTATLNESEERIMVQMQDGKAGSDSDGDTQPGRNRSIRQHMEVSVVSEEVDANNLPKAPRLW
ncbi:hypothetical protein N657DRAFT_572064 [Parathielavia appendiculata]|uniref:Rhodopsin domain-containing protein n=1 Tax=Parathielavia appendiculata TaxID=2587402 RepID=A0AAN6Z4M3_9PEZI|nr:hypothetical protein N657DRAFT_572064 [Parathielavia appendiculata]